MGARGLVEQDDALLFCDDVLLEELSVEFLVLEGSLLVMLVLLFEFLEAHLPAGLEVRLARQTALFKFLHLNAALLQANH